MMIETTQQVPLTLWKDGSIRVKGTRLMLDLIIYQYKQGKSPEQIAESFPAVRVAEVYSIIAYYLTHKDKIEKYLKKQEREAKEIKGKIESMPDYREKRKQLRETLLNRQSNLQK